MKLSATAALVLVSVTVLLSHADVAHGASVVDERQLKQDHVPLQVNPSLDRRGWRAPVIDEKLQPSPVEKQKLTTIAQKQAQRSSPVKELVNRSRSQQSESYEAPVEDKEKQYQRVHISYESNSSGQQLSSAPHTQHKTHNPTKVSVAAHHKDSADPTAPGLQQSDDDNKQDDGTGDLFEAGGMVTHQYYNVTQVQEQARMVSAAVKMQMAKSESLRQDISNSLVGTVAVVGLVVGAVGVIVAVMALLRQYSAFPEVELESDLPDAEAGRRVHAARSSATEVELVVSAGASEKASDVPSDVEEEETKEGDV